MVIKLIFVDTGALLVRYLEKDQHHDRALRAWQRLEDVPRLVTSNFVLDELFTLLGRRASYAFAADRARHILSSERLEILRSDAETEAEAIDLFEKYADQKVSFTDCTSFALMRRHKIRQVFTFDRHFELAGFVSWPPADDR